MIEKPLYGIRGYVERANDAIFSHNTIPTRSCINTNGINSNIPPKP